MTHQPARTQRRDAVRNFERILEAARDVFGESGADACMEEIAARAGVGVGTVYRRFASKDALIDELLRIATDELVAAAGRALARTDGHGLEELLRAFGQSFADHARYANLLLERQPDPGAANLIRQAIGELTVRAIAAGAVSAGVTVRDVMALISAMRGLVQANGDLEPDSWQRFLDIHLAGMARPGARRLSGSTSLAHSTRLRLGFRALLTFCSPQPGEGRAGPSGARTLRCGAGHQRRPQVNT